MRSGCSASSIPKRSATASGAWLGSITPPEPTRILEVLAAMCAISVSGRGGRDRRDVVVLGDPEAPEAEVVGALGEAGGAVQRVGGALAGADGGEIED